MPQHAYSPLDTFLGTMAVARQNREQPDPDEILDRLIREQELSYLRDELESIEPEQAILLIRNAPRGRLMRRVEQTRMANRARQRQGRPLTSRTGAPRPRREELMPERRPAPGDVGAFPALRTAMDSVSAVVGDRIRRGRSLPDSSDASGLTRAVRPNEMRLRPDFAEDRGVIAHEGGHLLDFRDLPAAESAKAAIPEEDLPDDASRLEEILAPILDTGDRGEGFAEEVERAWMNVDDDTDDEVQQALRELLRNRLARGERRARERTRFARDATAVRQ